MTIPGEFHIFFWDRSVGSLSWEKDKYYITARFLEYGNFRALNWLQENYQYRDFLREFLESTYARQLSRRTLNFWKTILNIKRLPWETEDYLKFRKKYWIS
jgi:hypothetical protein